MASSIFSGERHRSTEGFRFHFGFVDAFREKVIPDRLNPLFGKRHIFLWITFDVGMAFQLNYHMGIVLQHFCNLIEFRIGLY